MKKTTMASQSDHSPLANEMISAMSRGAQEVLYWAVVDLITKNTETGDSNGALKRSFQKSTKSIE